MVPCGIKAKEVAMRYISNLVRITGKIKRSSNSKLIAFGIWAIACILLYDRVKPNINVGTIIEIGQEFRDAANNALVVEKVAPFVPHRPFDPNHAKMVLILAYQRVGSSFTGQIFNQNPDYFYLFEPVDGIYSAMYGTGGGYAVPSDIAYFWNGTKRNMPRNEAISVGEVMGSLLTCDFDNVPTEVLVHKFFFTFAQDQRRLFPYYKCFKQKHLNVANCREHIKHICPRRFGEDMNKHMYCKKSIWNKKYSGTYRSYEDKRALGNYNKCILSIRKKVSSCIPLMQKACKEAKVRTSKTVRLTMEIAEYMFKHFPNFRVVHLIRDPRAVALSRMGHSTFRGKLSASIPKEAELYCKEVLEDIKVRNRIEERFPGSVMQIIYEHVVSNPIEQIKGVYSFINETMPSEVEIWLNKNTEGKLKNSTMIAEKWQDRLTFKIAKQVSDACSELYTAVNYRWPL